MAEGVDATPVTKVFGDATATDDDDDDEVMVGLAGVEVWEGA